MFEHIPPTFHVPLEFLLAVSLVAGCFSYIWPIVASSIAAILGFAFPRVNWTDILMMTIGHAGLALALGSLARASSIAKPSWSLAFLLVGGATLFGFIVVHVYDISISTSRERVSRSRAWNAVAALLLLLWVSAYAVIAWTEDVLPALTATVSGSIRLVVLLPYASYVIAALGAIVLPPLLVKAIFACIGLLEQPFNRPPELR